MNMMNTVNVPLYFKKDAFVDISPITKIIVFIISSIIMMRSGSILGECNVGGLTALFLLNTKEMMKCYLFVVTFFGTIAIEGIAELVHLSQNFSFVFIIFNVVRVFLPAIAMFYILAEKTTTSEYLAMFKTLHIPDAFAVAFVVMLRFIPTLLEHLKNIRQALVFRNINIGPIYFLKHPILSIERLVVPMLISSGKVMEELSAAAMTRGLDVGRKRTTIIKFRLNIVDYFVIFIAIALVIIFKGG
ncbi:energy-coupling factor transporter transmembrane component T [Staphylococcus aureus]|uniref:energy-coupling factor transporter transmembrane component T n=2 Tax=Staphylococcus TaxID=1279 RepID=UPI001D0D6029|nr:energy-coupling factor transporter transmembrane component T [Staphylococcus aureus]HDJ5153401.1 energy-coupling factor transporter transmembrane protein EcfT [Staphylococcus aureus]HDJ5199599.1 energy-coupling factor transporter transmembrane protein EcfT [Staphylococcus aureus]HDJ5231869.1 energy-coupling factor transporter transmembrane protein EcfT [Staphylococcus aureus]HDJ5378259.1 energy-coupling factor transporter transmembrane protein EcfT [Staphylococcus aureus]HDP2066390.1 energy